MNMLKFLSTHFISPKNSCFLSILKGMKAFHVLLKVLSFLHHVHDPLGEEGGREEEEEEKNVAVGWSADMEEILEKGK